MCNEKRGGHEDYCYVVAQSRQSASLSLRNLRAIYGVGTMEPSKNRVVVPARRLHSDERTDLWYSRYSIIDLRVVAI